MKQNAHLVNQAELHLTPDIIYQITPVSDVRLRYIFLMAQPAPELAAHHQDTIVTAQARENHAPILIHIVQPVTVQAVNPAKTITIFQTKNAYPAPCLLASNAPQLHIVQPVNQPTF